MKIIFASANKNKIAEIKAMLPPGIELLGLTDIDLSHEIPETGSTIRENSSIKATYVVNHLAAHAQPAMPVFADDSGLEVMALGGAPGVNSAYYAGPQKNDLHNNEKLLAELNAVTDRRARFVTVITLCMNDKLHIFEGEVNGTIALEPRGSDGFGYDPLFIPRGYRSTFSELGPAVKNTISHRFQAVQQLIAFLHTLNIKR